MVNILDMKDIRYINLFGQITGVNTRYCFFYNEFIVFGVPKKLISKAIGKEACNIRKMSETLGRKIKVVGNPNDDSKESIREFVRKIVSPVEFKDLEVTDEEIILTAGNQSKAALIGRNRRRETELKEIVKDYFKKDLRIV